jgi:hypothetical protein
MASSVHIVDDVPERGLMNKCSRQPAGTTSHQRSTLPTTGEGTVSHQDSRSSAIECSLASGYRTRVCQHRSGALISAFEPCWKPNGCPVRSNRRSFPVGPADDVLSVMAVTPR